MLDSSFDLDSYRARIAALAERGIFVGTSSWKYLGWVGQIYSNDRYVYRGKFANTRFERECLREYAETFKTVCFDGAYYTFQTEDRLREMGDQVPADFRFAFKVTDLITLKRFPALPRFGEHAGKTNPEFLNAGLFVEKFLRPLESIRSKVGPVMFEFSKFYSSDYESGSAFTADLDRFFSQLPKGWLYGVELRNKAWLGTEYLDVLKKHQVAHVYNNWTDMPPVTEQLGIVGEQRIETAAVARFLLKTGRKYEEAVSKFQPYTHTQEVSEEGRSALAALIERGWLKPSRDGVYLYINNRLEGNALMTVLGVLDRLHFLPKSEARPKSPEAKAPKNFPASKRDEPQLDLGL